MVRNFFISALRSIRSRSLYSLINIFGLSVGMGVCLVICQYLYTELSYDTFHEKSDRVYRLIVKETSNDVESTYPQLGFSFGEKAVADIPGVEAFVRKNRFGRGAIVNNLSNNNIFHQDAYDIFFVDQSFFDVFDFPLISGNKRTVFDDKYNIVITEKAAVKYFGNSDPIGKLLKVDGPPSAGTYRVSGVLEDLPENTHWQFDILMPMENFLEYGWGGAVKKQGGWSGFKVVTYLQLEPSIDPDKIALRLSNMLADQERLLGINKARSKEVLLQPLTDIYLHSNELTDPGYLKRTGSAKNIPLFAMISIVILILAWVNYINLSTAMSLQRAKEVGVRKSIGAYKNHLITQFLMESLLINLISAVLAVGLAYLILPILNQILEQQLTLAILKIPFFLTLFGLVVLIGSFIAGIYPAFVLSSFPPASIFGTSKGLNSGNYLVRRAMVFGQFLASVLLTSGTFLIYSQIKYLKNQDLGIDIEQIVLIRGPQVTENREELPSKIEAFKNTLVTNSSVSDVSGSFVIPGNFWLFSAKKPSDSEKERITVRGFPAGMDFASTFGLELIAGETFRKEMPDEEVVLLNKSAVSAFGFKSIEGAINRKVVISKKERTIVGVVKDFHWHSLAEGHKPYVVTFYREVSHPYISLRLTKSDMAGSLSRIEQTFGDFFPGNPFDYFFADEAFNQKYKADEKFGGLFLSFTILAIVIACIGLFTLVSYSMGIKVKEIGVRKVLGASNSKLVILLSKEYLIILAVANAVAIPLFYYWGAGWLDDFAYRLSFGLQFFLIPGLMVTLISLATVSYRTFRAAQANPVQSLRSE